jgi:hypothetical protein
MFYIIDHQNLVYFESMIMLIVTKYSEIGTFRKLSDFSLNTFLEL